MRIDGTKHDGDCSIYASLGNGRPEAGICTCGFGHRHQRQTCDDRHLYSEERRAAEVALRILRLQSLG